MTHTPTMKPTSATMRYTRLDTPIGSLLLAGTTAALELIVFPSGSRTRAPDATWQLDAGAFDAARRQLDEYFSGRRRHFELDLAPRATPFQRKVLDALLGVGYGETCSYTDIARRIGAPRAVRAVGAANGANPLPIVIPCHRVLGADGSLTGFGGGLERKRWLLDHERRREVPTSSDRTGASDSKNRDRAGAFL
jgi:methylated-DNA-[protein]-cysteine S-methyltransferase